MTTYQLEAFIRLSETLNYTKAAKLLHTTQPNLSKMIAAMEQELGVQLLARNRRDVRLTPAGESFYEDARRLIAQYGGMVQRSREIDAGIQGVIDVGFLGTALGGHLPRIVNTFREKYPRITLNLRDYSFSPLMDALTEEKIDVAFIPDRELDGIPRIEKKFLFADDMCVVMHKNHPLAGLESVDLALLKDEPFVMMDPKVSMRDYVMVSDICTRNGFTPKVSFEANTLTNVMLMVECKAGVSILAEHMTRFKTDYLRFVRIEGCEGFFKMICAWRRGVNPSVEKMIEVIDTCYG